MTDEWEAGTFAGTSAAHRRDAARTTVAERLAWLARAQQLAASTGAMQTELDRRAAEQLARWNDAESTPSRTPPLDG